MDDKLRQRAYALWERSGKADGSEMDFWLQAEREVGARRRLNRCKNSRLSPIW
ncbi:DUF2934 domain-containing protein [Bradyrhizobium sp. B120]|uniref:DUF2934 domain-containing protein n=1 Tax=Bradyrhizobium sp. B120 TaxID=3410088 RepID=UPI003B9863C9